MARRLNPEEEHLFNELLQASDAALAEIISDPFLRLIRERRNAGLVLSSELDVWLSHEPSGRPPS